MAEIKYEKFGLNEKGEQVYVIYDPAKGGSYQSTVLPEGAEEIGVSALPQPGTQPTTIPAPLPPGPTTPSGAGLTTDQVDTFTQLIRDNPKGWEGSIKTIKEVYPEIFGDVEPYTEDQKSKWSAEQLADYLQRRDEYKKAPKPDVDPASITTGDVIILADPCKNNFFAQTEAYLSNFFKLITRVGNFALNLPGEISEVVGLIGSAAKGFIGQIMNTVTKALTKWIKSGMASLAQQIFNTVASPIDALAKVVGVQSDLLNPVNALFKAIKCLAAKVSDALTGVIEDMIVGMVKNVLNVPTCAVQEFIGALTGKITGLIDSFLGPLLGPIQSVLGTVFKVRDAVLTGINTIRKIANLFKCGEKRKCPTTYKYKIDVGILKDRDNEEQKDDLDKALDFSLSGTVGRGLNDFQNEYGNWSIFGEKVGDSDGTLPPCNTGNIFKCGTPKVEFFGGGGSGVAGEVILGNFINKLDQDDIFGGVQKTASIVGVNITQPGEGYTEAPFVAFSDGCEQGYGAYGRAIIDTNRNSPTYGEVTSVVVFSEGENYPAEAPQDSFIDTVVIEDPGTGYADDDVVENDDVTVTFSGGSISKVELKKQSAYRSLPELNIRTITGSGAIIRPVMTTRRRPQTEVARVIDCVS